MIARCSGRGVRLLHDRRERAGGVPDDPAVAGRVVQPGGQHGRPRPRATGARPPARQASRRAAAGCRRRSRPRCRGSGRPPRSRCAPRGRSRPAGPGPRSRRRARARPVRGDLVAAVARPPRSAAPGSSSRVPRPHGRAWSGRTPRCSTLGVRFFIRVPSPAARMITAAGPARLTLGSSISLQALGLLRAAGPCPPAIHAPDPGRIPPGCRPGPACTHLRHRSPSGPRPGPPSRRSAPTAAAAAAAAGRRPGCLAPFCQCTRTNIRLCLQKTSISAVDGSRPSPSAAPAGPAARSRNCSAITQQPHPERGAQGRAAASRGPGGRTPRTSSGPKPGNCASRASTTTRSSAELGVSKSSVSLWVRDLPRPDRLSYEECRKRAAEGVRRYWAAERPIREAAARSGRARGAAAEIGPLTEREILIAGAIAYWCEGAKNKPYRRQ